MNNVLSLMHEHIVSGLKRKSLTSCSRWALNYRVMGKPLPGPWTFRYHPWLKELHDLDSQMWVGQKAAQMGFTEVALNRVFFKIDIEQTDCLYVLPAKNPDASDFSASRFDSALDLSTHLSKLFSDVKNVGHKRAGSTNLYIRGSRSKSSLKSVPVGLLILDEVEEMTQENIPLAMERQSGQLEKQTIAISTPRAPGLGINMLYDRSTQEHFFFNCPKCGRHTELIFPNCLVITADHLNDPRINDTYLICKECKNTLDHKSKTEWLANGKWVAGFTDRETRGVQINQLYSSTVSPIEFARAFLEAEINPANEQEFHNSKLGETHLVDGAKITEPDINQCIREYLKKDEHNYGSGLFTLGIDQGKWIHYEIDYWQGSMYGSDPNSTSRPKLVDAGKLLHFEDLDNLMKHYGINACVIDAQPERRKACEFANRFFGKVYLCFYGFDTGKILNINNSAEPTVTVDRTYWMDTALSRFKKNRIIIPKDIGMEYKQHIMAPMRIYEKDKNGNPTSRYIKKESDADHHAHARTYAEIALNFAVLLSQSHSIKSPR